MAEQSNNNEVLRTIKRLGDDLLSELIAEVERQNLIASRTLLNSLNYRVVEAIKFVQYKLEMRGTSYVEAAFNGRKSGKQPPLSVIKQYCVYKGIPKSAAWGIAVHIGRYGVKPKNVIANVLKSSAIDKFKVNINEAYKKQIKEQIQQIINQK
jgi:hypothetical protein